MRRRVTKLLSIKQLRNIIGNAAVTHKFADKHDLVYFGSVGRHDESRVVQGITLSNSNLDKHYLVGSVHGRDLIFLQRSDTLRAAMRKKSETYCWNILAIDLVPDRGLPHVYIEGKSRHGHGFYETLAMKKREFAELPLNLISNYDPLFYKRFIVRLAAATAFEFPRLIQPEAAAVLAHHFSGFDFELEGDMLYVYFLSPRPSFAQLEYMLKAGVWLAGELDSKIERA